MKFCKNCGNMYYLSVSEEDPNTLTLYCRNCGDTEENETDFVCIRKTENGVIEANDTINQYTKLDPTLPRISKMKCPNEECLTNTENSPVEIILIRYDNSNMKYLYLCSTCEFSWKTDVSKT